MKISKRKTQTKCRLLKTVLRLEIIYFDITLENISMFLEFWVDMCLSIKKTRDIFIANECVQRGCLAGLLQHDCQAKSKSLNTYTVSQKK